MSELAAVFFNNLPSQVVFDTDTKEYMTSLIANSENKEDIEEALTPFLQDADLDSATIEDLLSKLIITDGPTETTELVALPVDVTLVKETTDLGKAGKQSHFDKKSSDLDVEVGGTAASLEDDQVEGNEPEITATSQTSRFHSDTITTLNNDIDMKGINISINDKTILQDSHLKLQYGTHYGLIGRNGVGKTTFLKSIGYNILSGFPENIRVLFIEQVGGGEVEVKSVLNVVLDSDVVGKRVVKEIDELEKAVETGDPAVISKVIHQLKLNRLHDEYQALKKICIKRSGARGWAKRKELVILEESIKKMKEEYIFNENSHVEATQLLQDLYVLLSSLDTANIALGKATKILHGLGFSDEMLNGSFSLLSGGWKSRVLLARALFLEPDLLLLDEPTNHLDIPAILWLQRYLRSFPGTLVIISHDRSFLNNTTTEIIVMKNQSLTYHVGNYDEYIVNLEDLRKRDTKRKEAYDKKAKHIMDQITKGNVDAHRKGDDKKLKTLVSRKKKLTERGGLDVNESGHRFKLNRDMPGYHTSSRFGPEIESLDVNKAWYFKKPFPFRSSGSMIEFDEVSFSYTSGGRVILHGVDLNIAEKQKVAFVGPNGHGKSTLVKLIMQSVRPSLGSIKFHQEIKIGYLSQDQVETQNTDITINQRTAIQHFQALYPHAKSGEVRKQLGSFGIGAEANQTLKSLSGGQSVRVAIALACFDNPNLLVFDEPTNHLDLGSIEVLADALKSFDGAAVIVSHDRWFVKEVAEKTYLVEDGRIRNLESIDDYRKEK